MAGISSINRQRISTYHVNRRTDNIDVSQIDRLQPVNPVHNTTAHANDNFTLFSEVFYRKLNDLRRFYKQFYASEQALEDLLEKFRHGERQQPPEALQALVKELVEKYNRAYQSLSVFEKEIGIQHSSALTRIVRKYMVPLNRLGITLLETGLLELDAKILARNLTHHPDYLEFLFRYRSGFLRELTAAFRSIQAHPNQSPFQKNLKQAAVHYTRGMIMDEKS